MTGLRDAPGLYLGFIALHLLLGHLGSSLVYRLRFGRSPLAYARRSAHGPHTAVTRRIGLAALAWAATMVAGALSDAWVASWPGRPLLALPPALGWGLAVPGLVGMLAAQYGMGAAFRIGVDDRERPAVQARGLFAASRNPIYLGSFLYLLGASLWAPAPATLCALALVGRGMHRLVLLEESFLRARCGAEYVAYCARVPRYL